MYIPVAADPGQRRCRPPLTVSSNTTTLAAKAHQWRKFEHRCRYIARPAVTIDRLTLTR